MPLGAAARAAPPNRSGWCARRERRCRRARRRRRRPRRRRRLSRAAQARERARRRLRAHEELLRVQAEHAGRQAAAARRRWVERGRKGGETCGGGGGSVGSSPVEAAAPGAARSPAQRASRWHRPAGVVDAASAALTTRSGVQCSAPLARQVDLAGARRSVAADELASARRHGAQLLPTARRPTPTRVHAEPKRVSAVEACPRCSALYVKGSGERLVDRRLRRRGRDPAGGA